jgi:hypothetical protein
MEQGKIVYWRSFNTAEEAARDYDRECHARGRCANLSHEIASRTIAYIHYDHDYSYRNVRYLLGVLYLCCSYIPT